MLPWINNTSHHVVKIPKVMSSPTNKLFPYDVLDQHSRIIVFFKRGYAVSSTPFTLSWVNRFGKVVIRKSWDVRLLYGGR